VAELIKEIELLREQNATVRQDLYELAAKFNKVEQ
jgi:hypothetical protein